MVYFDGQDLGDLDDKTAGFQQCLDPLLNPKR